MSRNWVRDSDSEDSRSEMNGRKELRPEELVKRLEKLERKLQKKKRHRRHHHHRSRETSEHSRNDRYENASVYSSRRSRSRSTSRGVGPRSISPRDLDITPVQENPPTDVSVAPKNLPEQPSAPGEQNSSLCENILSILGNKLSEEKILSKEIHPDIACRWNLILTKGLSTDTKSELVKKYPAPSNCTLMEAPLLNPEARAAMQPNIIQRDARLATIQTQMGSCLSALGQALTHLIEGNQTGDNVQLIEWVSDTGRLLSDLHHTDSETRRLFITSSVNLSAKETMTRAPIGEFLFGDNLEERINSAKSLEKVSSSLKNNKPDYKKPDNNKKLPLNSKSLPYFRRQNQPTTGALRFGRQQSHYNQQDTRRSSKPQGGQRYNASTKTGQSAQSYRRK